jgi:hypothetical protein
MPEAAAAAAHHHQCQVAHPCQVPTPRREARVGTPAAARRTRTRCQPSACRQGRKGTNAGLWAKHVAVKTDAACTHAAAQAAHPRDTRRRRRHRTSPNIWEISGEVTKSPAVPKTSRCRRKKTEALVAAQEHRQRQQARQ